MSDSILLYRYMSARAALKSIEARRFKVGRLKDFNDPYEWRVGIAGVIPGGESLARACVDSWIEQMNSEFGILCFSDTFEEPVLWSHYADCHRGVAFEVAHSFDPEHVRRMLYSECRPVFDARRFHERDGGVSHCRELIPQMIWQKSAGWAYEREYRVHVALSECEIEDGVHYRRIPDDFVSRVILGFRCPLEEADVRGALHRCGLTPATVVRAGMDDQSYRIRC